MRMNKVRIKFLNLAFIFIFLNLTLFINFFHTEEIVTDTDNCPACQFQNSSITTSQTNFFILPPPPITGDLEVFYSFDYNSVFFIESSSRSPPEF
jgi:hypothetical protein